jgi:capsular polysaccharide transport system permease protein
MTIRIRGQSAWRSQILVTKALFKRELVTRFGKYKLGALWMLIDPLLSVIVLGLILGPILGRSSGNIPYAFFLLCGFMLLKLLTGPMSAGTGAIKSNQGLLIFKQVQPLDPFISRYAFELFTTIFAFVTFCFVGSWLGIEISASYLGGVAICFLATWLIGCGLGIALGVACIKFKELEKIQGYLQRPLLFVSAVLYPIERLPAEYAKYLLYNPLVHTIEYTRMCLFPGYDATGVSLAYPCIFALVSLALGMMVYRNNRHFLAQR